PPHDIAGGEETKIPGRERGIAMSTADFSEASCVGSAGPAQEVIQDMTELPRRHPLVFDEFQREVVVVSQSSRKAIAQFHEIEKAVGQYPLLNLVKSVERTAAGILHGIGGLVGGEHAERGPLRLTVLVDVARVERALAREERRFRVDDV